MAVVGFCTVDAAEVEYPRISDPSRGSGLSMFTKGGNEATEIKYKQDELNAEL